METFAIEEIMSGEESDVFWVTVGFSSSLEENDVLHIVCAKSSDQNTHEGCTEAIYLERFDQAYSCYGGAIGITADPESIEVHLNKHGEDRLSLPERIRFKNRGVPGYAEALTALKTMGNFPWGKSVVVA